MASLDDVAALPLEKHSGTVAALLWNMTVHSAPLEFREQAIQLALNTLGSDMRVVPGKFTELTVTLVRMCMGVDPFAAARAGISFAVDCEDTGFTLTPEDLAWIESTFGKQIADGVKNHFDNKTN